MMCNNIWHYHCAITGLEKHEFISFKQACKTIKSGISAINIKIICKTCDGNENVSELTSSSTSLNENVNSTPVKLKSSIENIQYTPSAPTFSQLSVSTPNLTSITTDPTAPTLSQFDIITPNIQTKLVTTILDESFQNSQIKSIRPTEIWKTTSNNIIKQLNQTSNRIEKRYCSTPPTTPTKTACWGYNAGKCTRIDCKLHHFTNICPTLEMHGKCSNGTTCHFEHPILCKYNERNICKNRNRFCKFFHKKRDERNTFLEISPEMKLEIEEIVTNSLKKYSSNNHQNYQKLYPEKHHRYYNQTYQYKTHQKYPLRQKYHITTANQSNYNQQNTPEMRTPTLLFTNSQRKNPNAHRY
jgi:hypothetical protein